MARLRARLAMLEHAEAGRNQAETSLRETTGRLSGIIATQEEIARTGLDLNGVLRLIVQRAEELTGADGAVIELVEGNDVIYRTDSGSARSHTSGIPQFKSLGGLSALSVTTGKIIVCEDSETDPRVNPEACRGLNIKSLVAVPIYYQRKVVGVLKIFSPYPGAFGQREVETLQLLEGQIVTALSHSAEFEAKQALLAERTASLAALRESEERFKSAFNNSAIGMTLVTPDNRFLQVNPAFCRMLGYTEQELQGKSTDEITHPADRASNKSARQQLLARQVPALELEKRYLHQTGRVVWVWINASLFRSGEGQPLYFICQVQDITARKLAEETLKQLNTELEARVRERTALLETAMEQAETSRRHFAFLAGATALLVSSLEYRDSLAALIQMSVPYLADYGLVELLEEDQTLFQMSASDLDPSQDRWLYDFHQAAPVDLAGDSPFAQALRTGKSMLYSDISDDLLKGYATGPEQLAQLQPGGLQAILIVPMVGRDKVIGAFSFFLTRPGRRFSPAEVALAEDLARRAAMAVDNNRLYREAQEAVRVQKELDYLKDLFVSIAGHELRTPLTAVQGFAQMLQRSLLRQPEPLDPAAHQEAQAKNLHYLDTITRQTNRMNGLIIQLLDFSKMQNGQFELTESGPVNLAELAQHVIEQQRTLEPDRRLDLSLEENPVIIRGDRDRLEQVLHNLISNACKYSPEGAPVSLELRTASAAEGHPTEAIIIVKDLGHGISPEDQPHIFDRFYRVRNRETARTGGLGLGLFISHEIVEQHHGRMWLESQPGQGSTFYIALPLAKSA